MLIFTGLATSQMYAAFLGCKDTDDDSVEVCLHFWCGLWGEGNRIKINFSGINRTISISTTTFISTNF